MTQPQLQASIEIKGDFRVGANPRPGNEFLLVITNPGEPVRQAQGLSHLFFRGFLGPGEEALFLNETDARKCIKKIPKDWKADWDFSVREAGKQLFGLKFYTFKKTLFNKAETISLGFSDVESKTAPGSAVLTFESDFAAFKQDLAISKTADKPGIISFFSEPPEGVPNFPHDIVTLNWRTYGLTHRELIQMGRSDPLPCNFERDDGSRPIKVPDTAATFRLQGYDGSRPIARELQVNVLGSGWHEIRNTVWEGDPGYPIPETETDTEAVKTTESYDLEPTLLFNANNQLLYGIFRHRFEGQEKAFLFQTENPFGGWDIVKSSVPDQAGDIPKGFSSSPGVYFNDELWLIGGSQIDQKNISNSVWCFDPLQNRWAALKDLEHQDSPTPRMGHAVLVFQNKIWVMGGRDESGNALNDVWILDTKEDQGQWHPLGNAPWSPRCLLAPIVFDHMIWLYGGAQEPSSAELFDDLYTCSYTNEQGAKWEKQELTGVIEGSESKKPIASCMQVFKGQTISFRQISHRTSPR